MSHQRKPRSNRLVTFLATTAVVVGVLVSSPARSGAQASNGLVGSSADLAAHLAVGLSHTCVASSVGTVKCWGSNASGELGLGDQVSRGGHPNEMGGNLPAVDLGTEVKAIGVATGASHSCAVLDGGQVKCWGADFFGTGGTIDNHGDQPGEMGNSLPILPLPAGRRAVAVSAGYDDDCAVLDNGQASCWGLHFGVPGSVTSFGAGRTVLAIAMNYFVACALRDDRTIACQRPGLFPPTQVLGDGQFVAVDMGQTSVCGIRSGGDVRCQWISSLNQPVTTFDLGAAGRTASGLMVADFGPCAIVDAGARIHCTGLFGPPAYDIVPPAGRVIVAIDGFDFVINSPSKPQVCVLYDNGRVSCFSEPGSGTFEGLGQQFAHTHADLPTLPPIDLGSISGTASVATGFRHTCALLVSGGVSCFGAGGLLGLGDSNARGDQPGEVGALVDLGAGRSASQIAAGTVHTCSILNTGSVTCWGIGSRGKLGRGNQQNVGDLPGQMGNALVEVNLGVGHTAIALALGSDHTCVVIETHQAKCWGSNDSGQLGIGSNVAKGDDPNELGDALPTVNLGTGRSIVKLVALANANCALLDDRSVKCWGQNESFSPLGYGYNGPYGVTGPVHNVGDAPGELGDALPRIDFGLGFQERVTDLGGGSNHLCVRIDSPWTPSRNVCWGSNAHGQLGSGSTSPEVSDGHGQAVRGFGALDTTALTGGGAVTCAVTTAIVARCWGNNQDGQLGLGTAVDVRGTQTGYPTVLLSVGGPVQSIVSGGSHTCAVLVDHSLKCWGRNDVGQLGLGDVASRGATPETRPQFLPIVSVSSPFLVGL